MRVIILRPWANQSAFVVVVILISQIPINPVMKLDGQARLRGLKAHRIRSNQGPRGPRRIRYAIALAGVLIYTVRGIQRCPRSDLNYGISEKEMVPAEIQTIGKRMRDAVEKIVK